MDQPFSTEIDHYKVEWSTSSIFGQRRKIQTSFNSDLDNEMIDTFRFCIKFPVLNQSECSVLINVGKINKEFNVALSDLRC